MSISNTLLLTKGLVSSATIPSRTWMMYNFQWLKITICVISIIEHFIGTHRRYLAFLCIVSQKVEKNLVENRKSGWTCWINKRCTLDKSCLVSRLILSTISSHQPLHIVWKQTFKTHVIPYILSSVAVNDCQSLSIIYSYCNAKHCSTYNYHLVFLPMFRPCQRSLLWAWTEDGSRSLFLLLRKLKSF